MLKSGENELKQPPEPRYSGMRLFRWSRGVLPPDYDPERRVDALTWAEAIFEPIALLAATLCFVLGFIGFGLALAPRWQVSFLAPMSILVGVEAFLYARRKGHAALQVRDWLVYLVPPLVAAKFLPYFFGTGSSITSDVAVWWQNPASFLSLDFLSDAFVLLMTWGIVFACTKALNQLRVQPGELREADDARYSYSYLYEDNWRSIDHSGPLRLLGRFYLWGGVILVILGALASIGVDQLFTMNAIAQLFTFSRPSIHLVLANVVVYFVVGLLLLGEAHYVRQRTLWRIDDIAIPREIATRWIGAVVGLVVAAILVAIVLPTSYAMTLGDIITTVLGVIVQAVTFVLGGIIYLLFLVLSSLHRWSGDAPSVPHAAIPPHFASAPHPSGGPSPLDTVRSLLFWLVAFGIVLYSASVLWRRRIPLPWGTAWKAIVSAPWSILTGLLRFIGRLGKQVSAAVVSVVPHLFRRAEPLPRPRLRIVSLWRLSPRERIEYFYLSICERAARLGYPRPDGSTPAEFEEILRKSVPQVSPDIEQLTADFVEARYGPRETTLEQVGHARDRWQILKRKLRLQRLGQTKRSL
ncbi:MAG: DUF4129 domain-containing protein [Chloroflexi bacterium]|nr:DUF4129 domain-containing protein [Chloroflexota bacterium]